MATRKVKTKEFTIYTVDGPVIYLVPETSNLFSDDYDIQNEAVGSREFEQYEIKASE